jgi:hypothetical protein
VASGKNEISKRVDESLVAELGRVPSTYASSAYDAVWIVGLAMDREQSTDVALLRQAIPEIAAEHTGALGSTLLNDYGDLAQTNYDVWDIRDGVWTVAGTYFASSDTIKHDDGTGLSGEIQVGSARGRHDEGRTDRRGRGRLDPAAHGQALKARRGELGSLCSCHCRL